MQLLQHGLTYLQSFRHTTIGERIPVKSAEVSLYFVTSSHHHKLGPKFVVAEKFAGVCYGF